MADETLKLVLQADVQSYVNNLGQAQRASREHIRALQAQQEALRAEIAALKAAGRGTEEYTKQQQRLLAQNSRAIRESVRKNQALTDEAKAQKELTEAQRKQEASVRSLASAGGLLKNALLGVAAGFSAVKLINIADDCKRLEGRIKEATRATGDFNLAFSSLKNTSRETGVSLETNVNTFQRVSRGIKAQGRSTQDALDLTKVSSQLGVLSGASAESQRFGLTQFAQALTVPVVRAEEINSILENIPELGAAIEKGLGLAAGQLKNFTDQGKVLSKDVVDALLKQQAEIQARFDAFPKTVQRSLNAVQQSFSNVVGQIDLATGATESLANSLDFVASVLDKNSDGRARFAQGVNAVFSLVANGTNGILAAIAQTVLQTISAITQGVNAGISGLNAFYGFAQKIIPFLPKGSIAKFDDGAGRAGQFAGAFGKESFAQIGRDFSRLGQPLPTSKALPISGVQTGGLTLAPKVPKGKKAKAGASPESLENKRISNLLTTQRNRLDELDTSDAGLPLFATAAEKASLALGQLNAKMAVLKQNEAELAALSAFTADGQAKKADALKDVSNAIKDTQRELKVANREEAERLITLKVTLQERLNQASKAREDNLAEINLKGITEQGDLLQEEYERQKLTIDDYYDSLKSNIEQALAVKLNALDVEIAGQTALLEKLKATRDEQAIAAQQQKLVELGINKEALINDANFSLSANERSRVRDKRSIGEQLKSNVQQSLSSAIQSALTGGGVKSAVKQFADSFKAAVSNVFAEAIAARVLKATGLDKLLENIGGKATATNQATVGVKSGSGLSGLAGLKGLIGGGASSVLGPIAAAAAVGSFTSGFAASQGAPKGLEPLTFLSPAAGLLGGLFFGSRNKKSNRQVTKAVNTAFAGLDSNNLNLDDLRNRRGIIEAVRARGKAAKSNKNQGLVRLDELIAQRNTDIFNFRTANLEESANLDKQIALASADPYKRASLEIQQQLDTLKEQSQKALNQYRDSQQAQTEILAVEAKKRELILKAADDQFKNQAESLKQLLEQRDAAENANVFTRRKTVEDAKAEQIQALDKDINNAIASFSEFQKKGFALPKVEGINQLSELVKNVANSNQFQITINQAEDPNKTAEEVTRQIANFYRKNGVAAVY